MRGVDRRGLAAIPLLVMALTPVFATEAPSTLIIDDLGDIARNFSRLAYTYTLSSSGVMLTYVIEILNRASYGDVTILEVRLLCRDGYTYNCSYMVWVDRAGRIIKTVAEHPGGVPEPIGYLNGMLANMIVMFPFKMIKEEASHALNCLDGRPGTFRLKGVDGEDLTLRLVNTGKGSLVVYAEVKDGDTFFRYEVLDFEI